MVIDRPTPDRKLEGGRCDEFAGGLLQEMDIGGQWRQAVRYPKGTRQQGIVVAGKKEDRASQLFQPSEGMGHGIQGRPE